uniref:BLOC-2 complex member HPS3 N-terminal domain-containing protein n=1 Tax=Rhodnius prolixus TaxID=13249 RepID=T1HS38_RHOPR
MYLELLTRYRNYVATVEYKRTGAHGNDKEKDVLPSFTRVYTNWEKCDSRGMRARIAGRVTPSSSQIGGDIMELIELPSRFQQITAIACSQESGNILVCSHRTLCLYQRVTRTHDISRLKFIDFETWPVTLELSYSPTRLSICEDLVAASNSDSLHVFRINKGFARPTDWTTTASSSASSSPRKNGNDCNKDGEKINTDADSLLGEACKGIISSSSSILSTLSSIRCSLRNNYPELRVPPFKPPASVAMTVNIKEIPVNEPWAEQMTSMIESLLQLELWDAEGERAKDAIVCVALRPLYKISAFQSSKQESSCPRLRSHAYNTLVAFNCLVCTRLQGFMYHFPVEDGLVTSVGKCISEYNFTSLVKHIILQPYLLHAVTQTGLETYTLRSIHAIEEDRQEHLFHCGIFCFSDSGIQTIYSLRLSSTGTVYTDLLAVASLHTFTSPFVYCQLLSEAHSVLRTAISVTDNVHWENQLMEPCDSELYRESCALLSEYYLTRNTEAEWILGYEYSQLAGLEPTQLMERLKRFEQEANQCEVLLDSAPGLTYYLRTWIVKCGDDSRKLSAAALSALQHLTSCVTIEDGGCLLSSLVLQSPLLRQFSRDKTIKIITEHVNKNSSQKISALDCLAMTVLFSSKGKNSDAENALSLCTDSTSNMVALLIEHWPLLFDNTRNKNQVTADDWEGVTLSDLSVLLIEKKPIAMAETLTLLVVKEQTLHLQHILQVFLTYLPARMCTSTSGIAAVLQRFLEGIFNSWIQNDNSWNPNRDCDLSASDALKILMRSLLSDLIRNDRFIKEQEETWEEAKNFFGGKRYKYLDMLPPLSFGERENSQHIGLLKLQCLLCTGWLEGSSLSEMVQFVEEFVAGDLGYSLLILSQPEKAVELLARDHPNVLPQYTKDVLKSEPELKHIIATLQSKADEEEAGEKEEKVYSQILDEVIAAIAASVPCDVFSRIVPADAQQYATAECRNTGAHSTHLSDVIKATGHRMMATLNIKSFT